MNSYYIETCAMKLVLDKYLQASIPLKKIVILGLREFPAKHSDARILTGVFEYNGDDYFFNAHFVTRKDTGNDPIDLTVRKLEDMNDFSSFERIKL